MLRLAADENFNNDILRGLLRRNPNLEIIRVQDTAVSGGEDPEVLEWAATEGCVLLSHDVTTMTKYACLTIDAGLRMSRLLQVGRSVGLAKAIEDILLIAECSLPGEWEGQIKYLPL
jgi:uncharacterized protein DUF5615